MRVRERETECERKRGCEKERECVLESVCVCVSECVCERERKRERECVSEVEADFYNFVSRAFEPVSPRAICICIWFGLVVKL